VRRVDVVQQRAPLLGGDVIESGLGDVGRGARDGRACSSPAGGAGNPSSSRSAVACSFETALRSISPPLPPPGVWMWSSFTPNSRCTGPADSSIAWIRVIGTLRSSGVKMPDLKCTAVGVTQYVVAVQRQYPKVMLMARLASPANGRRLMSPRMIARNRIGNRICGISITPLATQAAW
jgi:hypothetical protein